MAFARIGVERPDEPASRSRGNRSRENRKRRGAEGLRSEESAAAESNGVEVEPGTSRAALHIAPHRGRWLVDGNPDQRDDGALSGLQRRKLFAARGIGDPVCRLRSLATEMDAG